MKHVRVRLKEAQKTLDLLKSRNMIHPDYLVYSEGDFLYIPVISELEDYEIVDRAGKPKKRKRNLKEILSPLLSKEEIEKIVSSYDIVGDIAVVEIPEELLKREKEIAKAIMELHKNVRVVVRKCGAFSGIYRVRPLEIIAGEKRTETIHKENGVLMKLDLSKVYFSPRLSYERRRIAEQVKEGERILALFAGVGPFPLVIAKQKKCEIVAVELNPDAVKYMKENVKLNKVNFTIVEGDVSEILENYENFADRVIMPLPKGGETFLKKVFRACKNNAIIHFYTFVSSFNAEKEAIEKIKKEISDFEVLNIRVVRPYSSSIVQVVVDFKVKK